MVIKEMNSLPSRIINISIGFLPVSASSFKERFFFIREMLLYLNR